MVRDSPPTDPALTLPLAGWWRRFGAGVVDTVIAWLLSALVIAIAAPDTVSTWRNLFLSYYEEFLAGVSQGVAVQPSQGLLNASFTLMMVLGGITACYSILLLGSKGATLGHQLMGVKVVKAPLPMKWLSLAGYPRFIEEKPGWMRAFSKGLGWALFSTGTSWFALVQVVNVLMPLFHPRKQSVTDVFASTLLVKVRPDNPTEEGSHA